MFGWFAKGPAVGFLESLQAETKGIPWGFNPAFLMGKTLRPELATAWPKADQLALTSLLDHERRKAYADSQHLVELLALWVATSPPPRAADALLQHLDQFAGSEELAALLGLDAWQQRLRQEGRTQPFAQLSREFYTDPDAARLIAGRRVRLGALYERLKRFGWHRDYDYGLYRRIDRNREAALRGPSRPGGALVVKQLTPDDLPACAFPAPVQAGLLTAVMNGGPVWTVAWVQGALLTPLAVLHPGGRLWGKPALTHLVPGIPKENF